MHLRPLMKEAMIFEVDMKKIRNIYRIVLDTTGSARDYPRGYEVTISKDGKFWSNPIAKGKGVSAITYIDFNPIETYITT